MKYLILVLALLTGCASTAEKQARQDRADALTEATVKAASVPLVKITCPPQGCVMLSFEVGNPASLGQLANAMQAANQHTTSEAGQIALAGISMLTTVGTGAIVSNGLQGIFKSVTETQRDVSLGGFAGMSKMQPNVTTTTVNNSVTASGAGSAAAMGGSSSASNPISNTTTTSTTNSNNQTANGGTATTGTGGAAKTGP
jgi:hypothetical protein